MVRLHTHDLSPNIYIFNNVWRWSNTWHGRKRKDTWKPSYHVLSTLDYLRTRIFMQVELSLSTWNWLICGGCQKRNRNHPAESRYTVVLEEGLLWSYLPSNQTDLASWEGWLETRSLSHIGRKSENLAGARQQRSEDQIQPRQRKRVFSSPNFVWLEPECAKFNRDLQYRHNLHHMGYWEGGRFYSADSPRQISIWHPFFKRERYFCIRWGRWKCPSIWLERVGTLYRLVWNLTSNSYIEIGLEQKRLELFSSHRDGPKVHNSPRCQVI